MPQGCELPEELLARHACQSLKAEQWKIGRRSRYAIVPILTRSTFFQASPLCRRKVTSTNRGSTSARGRPRCMKRTESLERR